MFSKVQSEANINIAVEVFNVLSVDTPKDALSVLQDTKRSVHEKIKSEAVNAVKKLSPEYTPIDVKSNEDEFLHYDVVVEILQVLVNNGLAKQQLGKSNTMEFLKNT